MSAEAGRCGHLVPFELLQQGVLRDSCCLTEQCWAVGVVGNTVVGVVSSVALGRAAVVGEARSQPNADSTGGAASGCSMIPFDAVLLICVVTHFTGGQVDGLPGQTETSGCPKETQVHPPYVSVSFVPLTSHHFSIRVNASVYRCRLGPTVDCVRQEGNLPIAGSAVRRPPQFVSVPEPLEPLLVRVRVVAGHPARVHLRRPATVKRARLLRQLTLVLRGVAVVSFRLQTGFGVNTGRDTFLRVAIRASVAAHRTSDANAVGTPVSRESFGN